MYIEINRLNSGKPCKYTGSYRVSGVVFMEKTGVPELSPRPTLVIPSHYFRTPPHCFSLLLITGIQGSLTNKHK